jgi:hypothetical protein
MTNERRRHHVVPLKQPTKAGSRGAGEMPGICLMFSVRFGVPHGREEAVAALAPPNEASFCGSLCRRVRDQIPRRRQSRQMAAGPSGRRQPDDCTLHGLRYTFATRAIEIGLDWQTIESIVGHKTAEMAFKYTQQRRLARLAIVSLDAARTANRETAKVGTAADESGSSSAWRGDK